MANYQNLKNAITNAIKTNGNQEITGNVMQSTLISIVNSLASGRIYKGYAVPTTNPGTPDENVFYICIRPGEYVNFGNAVLKPNSIGIFTNSNSAGWTLSQEQIYFNEFNLNVYKPGQYDLISAITEASKNVPPACQKSGFKLFFNDSNDKLRRYVFESNIGGFTNPTRWVEVFDTLYFDYHIQPLGLAYDIASLVKAIRVTTNKSVDVNDDYSIGIFGYSPTQTKNVVQICKNKTPIGLLVYEDGEFEKTGTFDDITFTVYVNSFEISAGGTIYDYKETNVISKQLFINANVQYEIQSIVDGINKCITEEQANNLFVLKEVGKNKFNKESQEIKQGYYKTGGVFVSNPDNFTTPKIPIKDGETLICNAANNTSSLIRQLIFDKDDNIIFEGMQTKTLTGIENSSYCIFSCNVGGVGIDGCQVEVGDVSTSYEPYVEYSSLLPRKKTLTLDYLNTEGGTEGQVPTIAGNSVIWRTPTGQSDVKVYGVKQSIADPTNMVWERTDDAVGLISATQIGTEPIERDDFLSVYPFSKMKECNIVVDATGATEIIYKGNERFGRDKDTFIEIPLFYMDRYIEDGYEYRKICEVQKGGFFPAPMFIENGKVLDRVYIAKYETSIGDDGKLYSKSGVLPCIEKTLGEFRTLYQEKGNGFAAMDIRTVMSLQHLYLVRFAQKNSQNYIGGGYTGLFQPYGSIAKDYSGITGSKNTIVTMESPSLVNDTVLKKFWVGSYVGFIRDDESDDPMYDRAKITEITVREDGRQATITLDKNVEFYTDTLWGSCGQPSGVTDVLTHDTGRSVLGVETNDGTCGVLMCGIENLWGNVWHELDGVIFKTGTCYVGFSQKDYNDEATGYVPIGTKMINQPDLGSVGAQFCFIGNLWVDSVYRWLGYPSSFRGGSPTDKQFPLSGITQDNSYGDAYYYRQDLAISIDVHGGGFDHYERSGFFCHRCWSGISSKWYLQGSRMQFKILD